jgi:hypothetical protein
MTKRSGADIEQPRVEPEIIPPSDVRSRRAGGSFDGTQRVYVARVGPFGFAMVALAIAALAMLLFLLVLGAFVILVPLAGLSRPRGWAVIPSGICGMRAAQKLSAG